MIAGITPKQAREILNHLQETRQEFYFDETGAIWDTETLMSYLAE